MPKSSKSMASPKRANDRHPAITEHVENAGVHSGDATIVLPPQRLYLETIRRAKKITARHRQSAPNHRPLQYPIHRQRQRNPSHRVQRPRLPLFPVRLESHQASISSKSPPKRSSENISRASFETLELDYVGVKTPQFSYKRLKGADPVANVEMASTGEVAHIGDHYLEAFFASWLSTEQNDPRQKTSRQRRRRLPDQTPAPLAARRARLGSLCDRRNSRFSRQARRRFGFRLQSRRKI